jgi:uncharacterized protein (DUF58 family)
MTAATEVMAPAGKRGARVFGGIGRWTRVVRSVFARMTRPVTPVGWTVAALGLIAWVIGWQLGWLEWSYIAAACFVSLSLSYAFTLGRSRLSVHLTMQPQRVVVGQRAGGQLSIRNVTGRRQFPVRIELPVGNGVAGFHIPSLPGDGEHDELFVIPTQRRAVIPVGPASSVRGDPLGMVRRMLSWTGVEMLFVHPRTLSLEQLGAGFLRDLEGQTTKDLSNNDIAFHTLRDYVAGDDRRHVHWKTTARTGQLMVRQFVDTRRSHLSVVLSGSPSDYADDVEFETAVSVAGSLALRAIRDEQDLTVVCSGVTVPTVSGQRLLDGLSAVEMHGSTADLVTGVRRVAETSPETSVAILVGGSRLDLGVIKSATTALAPDVRVLVMKVDPLGGGALSAIGNTVVVSLRALDDLPMAIRAVMQR